MTLVLMLAAGVGCASKGDSLAGTGGIGASGTGGTSQSGGAPGTGGTPGISAADLATLQGKLTAARATWVATKGGCGHYVYESDQLSLPFGPCSKTTIEILNDQPIRRAYLSCASVPDGGVAEQWSEVGDSQIDTHPDGAYPWIAEGLLDECHAVLNNVMANPSAYSVSLAINAQGVPVTCLATILQCVDDCTGGIDISSFACQPPDGADAGHD
jgi:hypothetical protein